MLHEYPAIVLRRLEDEDETAFQHRKDRCRNVSNSKGFGSPQQFEGNIFDENSLEPEVMQKLADWPCVIVHDAGDLADSRDEFAARLDALEAAGTKLIIVAQDIDLRGGPVESETAIKVMEVWRSLDGSEATGTEEDEEEEEELDTAPKPLKYPKGMTEEQHAIVRQHLATHGNSKPAELKNALGITSSGTAKNWMNWAEKNPLPVELAPNADPIDTTDGNDTPAGGE
jgi:hypothetical protein